MKTLQFLGQCILLWLISWAGDQAAILTNLPIPGNVLGMLLLFVLLLTGVIKLEYIQEAANFLLKHLVFFFIPVAVGLMNWGGLFYTHAAVLTLAIALGAALPFWAVGTVVERMHGRSKKCSSQ